MHAPLDVVLFEGWMLGFTPVATEGEEEQGDEGEGKGKGEKTGISIINETRHKGMTQMLKSRSEMIC